MCRGGPGDLTRSVLGLSGNIVTIVLMAGLLASLHWLLVVLALPEAEASIFAELKENLKGRIGIVISHRFSTVRIADRIAVIADGHVSELGSHEELLEAGGRYAELFELQAAGYR